MELTSTFDILRGLPPEGVANTTVDTAVGVALQTGTVVTFVSRQLASAKVLKMIDDTLTTAPTLGSADRGKAYVVAGTGGGWSSFAVGDIVEWDGSAWNRVVENSSNEPPDGTRVIVGAGAAGSFSGHTDKVMAYDATGDTWDVVDVPVNRNHIKIDGTGSIFYNMYFDYSGTHPNGFWYKSLLRADAPGVLAPATSVAYSVAAKLLGIVTRGYDNFDSAFLDKVTYIPLHAGLLIRAKSANAGTLVPGNLVSANNGAIVTCPTGTRPIGVVVKTYPADGDIVFVSM